MIEKSDVVLTTTSKASEQLREACCDVPNILEAWNKASSQAWKVIFPLLNKKPGHDLFSAKVDEEVPSASSPLISDDFSAHPWTTQATEIGFLKICILNLLLGLITAPAVHL